MDLPSTPFLLSDEKTFFPGCLRYTGKDRLPECSVQGGTIWQILICGKKIFPL